MPPLRGDALIAKFLEALREWKHDGYVDFNPRSVAWLRKNLPNCNQKTIARAMYLYVAKGGEINAAKENYEGYRDDHPHHYDYRVSIAGRPVYIETVFDDKRMGPTITVVNIKDDTNC
jgi:hypothetical protein